MSRLTALAVLFLSALLAPVGVSAMRVGAENRVRGSQSFLPISHLGQGCSSPDGDWEKPALRREVASGRMLLYEYGAGMAIAAGGERLAHDGMGSVVARVGASAPRLTKWGAFGEPLSGALSSSDASLGYAQLGWDDDVGLSYAQQRWYAPELGRFLSEDPLGVHGRLGNPGDLNPWAYAMGNPLRYMDPTGEAGVRTELELYRERAIAQNSTGGMLFAAFAETAWSGVDGLSFGTIEKLDAIHDAQSAGKYNDAAGADRYLSDVAVTAGVGTAKVVVAGAVGKAFTAVKAAPTLLVRMGQGAMAGGTALGGANVTGQVVEMAAGTREEFDAAKQEPRR